jgi:predicted MFS family arabinose efflux permease
MLALAYALALFQRMAFASVEPLVSERFYLTATQAGDLSSAFFWAYLLAQIPSGVLTDIAGSRPTAVAGLLIAAVGSLLFLVAVSFEMLILSRSVTALGCAMSFASMMRYACIHYREKSGPVIGRNMLVGNLGAIAAGMPLALLLSSVSYHQVWIAVILLTCVLALLICLGLGRGRDHGASEENPTCTKGFREIFQSPWCYAGMLVVGATTGCFYAFAGYAQLVVMTQHRVSHESRFWLLSCLPVGYALGAYFWGLASEKTENRYGLLALAIIGLVTCWEMLLVSDHLSRNALSSIYFLVGFCAGSASLIFQVFSSRYRKELRASAISVVACGISIGAAVGSMLSVRVPATTVVYPFLLAGLLALAITVICSFTGKTRSFKKARPALQG